MRELGIGSLFERDTLLALFSIRGLASGNDPEYLIPFAGGHDHSLGHLGLPGISDFDGQQAVTVFHLVSGIDIGRKLGDLYHLAAEVITQLVGTFALLAAPASHQHQRDSCQNQNLPHRSPFWQELYHNTLGQVETGT